MKTEIIHKLTESFETAVRQVEEIECWSARDLQELLGYTKWDNFIQVIDKAKIACLKSGQSVEDHFADVGKMVELGLVSQP
jgi:DNA-damage-inducible protein D